MQLQGTVVQSGPLQGYPLIAGGNTLIHIRCFCPDRAVTQKWGINPTEGF